MVLSSVFSHWIFNEVGGQVWCLYLKTDKTDTQHSLVLPMDPLGAEPFWSLDNAVAQIEPLGRELTWKSNHSCLSFAFIPTRPTEGSCGQEPTVITDLHPERGCFHVPVGPGEISEGRTEQIQEIMFFYPLPQRKLENKCVWITSLL